MITILFALDLHGLHVQLLNTFLQYSYTYYFLINVCFRYNDYTVLTTVGSCS